MFPLPDPLHPAVVHFPIVLLLVGAAAAIAAVFIRRWRLTWVSASLLTLGAIGAFVAVETGEASRELTGKLLAEAEALIESHEEWAERTLIAAAIAAVLAIVTVAAEAIALYRQQQPLRFFHPALGRFLRIITAAAALTSSFLVYQTARRGGEAVYGHGVGINLPAPGKPGCD